MKHSEEDDALWNLLGKAKVSEVSPFFARNVLRDVRALQEQRGGAWKGLLRWWKIAVPTSVAICAGAVFVLHQSHQQDQLAAIAAEVSESPDYLVISDLDDLLASEESAVWLDNSAY